MGAIGSSLDGKTCVVTGAARSIGFAVAEAYAAAGAHVAMLDVDPEVVVQAGRLAAGGASAGGWAVDITDRTAVLACFEKIRAEFGDPYALVNNAGIVDQRPFEEITPDLLDRMFRVNVHGTVYCIQAVLEGMKRRKDGKIINLSSKSGKTGSALMAPYSAAKGAIISLTQALAFEVGPYNIKVNCLCPGITDATGVWASVSRGYTENLSLAREDVVARFTAKVPLGRLAAVQDIVDFVLFLSASGEYCTGQAFNVTGGREMH